MCFFERELHFLGAVHVSRSFISVCRKCIGVPSTDRNTGKDRWRASGLLRNLDFFFFFFFQSSGGWVKIKLKLRHFHVSDTSRVSV